MLDRDLAELYEVETRVLNQAVRRNSDRFPEDFMFALTRDEIMNLSQIVISSRIKHAPNVFVFTGQGVAMLSGILNSGRAIQVNIAIMRTFVKLREIFSSSYCEINYDKRRHSKKCGRQYGKSLCRCGAGLLRKLPKGLRVTHSTNNMTIVLRQGQAE